MTRVRIAGLVLAAHILSVCLTTAQEGPSAPGSLTIEEVVRQAGAGVSDELIIARIKKNAKAFDLNTDEIVALKKSGVDETVIKYLLDPTLPYSPPAPVVATEKSPEPEKKKYPEDALADKVPADPGFYYVNQSQKFLPLDLKPIVPEKQPGKLGKLTGGHIIGSMAGPQAKIRVSAATLVFYGRLGGKIMIDDLVLLNVKDTKKSREVDFGGKPGTPIFPPKSVHQFDSKEVGPGGLYRITTSGLDEGEYVFYILGSEEDKKGLLGRGYDFGMD